MSKEKMCKRMHEVVVPPARKEIRQLTFDEMVKRLLRLPPRKRDVEES
jgi:hypothetical protein